MAPHRRQRGHADIIAVPVGNARAEREGWRSMARARRQRLQCAGQATDLFAQLLEPHAFAFLIDLMDGPLGRCPPRRQERGGNVGMIRRTQQLRPVAAHACIGQVQAVDAADQNDGKVILHRQRFGLHQQAFQFGRRMRTE